MYFNRIFLLVTDACDSRCTLCDYWLTKNPKFIDSDFVEEKVASFIKENGVSVVCISGGEPSLHPDLGKIVRSVRRAGATATLTTSTTRLETRFEEIRDLVTHYMISLDGADRETYRGSRGIDLFDHAVGWIRRLRVETSADLAISCVLQACNIASIRLIYELAIELQVNRIFFRVPDFKPHSFGRSGLTRSKTLKQVEVTPSEASALAADLEWIIKADEKHKLLGQSSGNLRRKAQFFQCVSENADYEEEDQLCDVPLTSLVIHADGTCRPCFYLPQVQPFNRAPLEGSAFLDVHSRMLNDKDFRKQWCNACQQFDGHKHLIERL
ncbi:radical SAM protein [Luteolibacter soli]|uniref:Radical SAM protein n=1 Tax=Luteolibacter soli TaxID=3135280 RepID=A0ABU9B2F9_9BACT